VKKNTGIFQPFSGVWILLQTQRESIEGFEAGNA
jgi:hypothetical protein